MYCPEIVKKSENRIKVATEALKGKIVDVIGREIYQAGYPKWDGIFIKKLPLKPGAQPGVTWCNEAAYAILTELGRYAAMILDKEHKDIKWTDADEMYNFALEACKNPNSGVSECSIEAGWNFARFGVPILVSAPHNGDEVGHLGIIMPTDDPADKLDPFVGQAGAKPGIRRLSESFFKYGLKPKLFHFYRYTNGIAKK